MNTTNEETITAANLITEAFVNIPSAERVGGVFGHDHAVEFDGVIFVLGDDDPGFTWAAYDAADPETVIAEGWAEDAAAARAAIASFVRSVRFPNGVGA